jgi:peptidylprolyl isomerase
VGKLENDTVFDASYSRNQPITFKLGAGRVIKGWEEGIALMHVGDSALLVIPPEIGYGERDMGVIPPNSTLYFTVVLTDVQKPVKPYDVTGLDTIALDSGLKYIEVRKGKGKGAKDGDRVHVHYTGYFTDGKKFDASYDRGKPIALVLGRHQVIKGWEMGLQGMKTGEQRRLLIPYTLAYGEQGRPPAIPAKADLVFDVEMVKIDEDAIPKPYDVSGKDTVTTKSGLKYIIVQKSEGERIVPGDTVTIKYVAYFEDGRILESTYERDDSLILITGTNMLIPGIMEGVSYLHEGEKARVIIPPALAFGEKGNQPMIPPNTTLIFDIYIQHVKRGKLAPPQK